MESHAGKGSRHDVGHVEGNVADGRQYAADIKASGVLVVNGPAATLTVKKSTKDANGSSTSTTTQEFRMNGGECLVSR